jgi:predicted branched-subunit amino acid permease
MLGFFAIFSTHVPLPMHGTCFTWPAFRQGMRDALPGAMGVAPWGLTFGLLAAKLALTLPQAVGMSSWLFSGTAQFVILDFWRTPFPWLAVLFGVFAINSRYLVQSATLTPWLMQLPAWHRALLLFWLVDISWALSLKRFQDSDAKALPADVGYMHGAQWLLCGGWIVTTAIGAALPLGALDLQRWGFDVAIPAILVGMVAANTRKAVNLRWLLSWGVALLTAYVARAALGGHWYVLIGGFCGALAAALLVKHETAPEPAPEAAAAPKDSA